MPENLMSITITTINGENKLLKLRPSKNDLVNQGTFCALGLC